MSQRNPMNERYTTEKHAGTTRKSSASAKPKTKAAGTVTYGSAKKTPKDRKAEQKARRREETEKQRELDRKYYKPDTERYKKLRVIWWVSLGAAVVFTALSWFLRQVEPTWIAMACLIAAYAAIIFAFYIDFSKIRKERREYQSRMLALEIEQKKLAEQKARQAAKQAKGKNNKKRSVQKSAAESDVESEDTAAKQEAIEEEPKQRKGFFSRKSKKAEPIEG